MATIDTLVNDIYAVFRDGVDISDDRAEEFGKAMANLIKTRLSKHKEEKKGLRLSSVGKPLRQLWYENHDAPKEEPLPHQKIKFLYGDIIEELMLLVSELAGHTVEDRQKTVEVNGVVGHQDAKIDGVIVDVKSVASPSFYKFADGGLFTDDAFGYIDQLSSYCLANGIKHGAFLAVDKQLGAVTLLELKEDRLRDTTKRIDEAREAMKSETPPPRCYNLVVDKKTGDMKLPFQCGYCPFKNHCYDNKLELEIIGGKPVHFYREEESNDKK